MSGSGKKRKSPGVLGRSVGTWEGSNANVPHGVPREVMKSSSLSTANGGITYSGSRRALRVSKSASREQQSTLELQALKCILQREKYISHLREAAEDPAVILFTSRQSRKRGSSSAHGDESKGPDPLRVLGHLLECIRSTTIETVDAIVAWRKAVRPSDSVGCPPAPFLWNGLNYLLKIPSDLDFLDHVDGLEGALGVNLIRNPFITSTGLDFDQGESAALKELSTSKGPLVRGKDKSAGAQCTWTEHDMSSGRSAPLKVINPSPQENSRILPNIPSSSAGGRKPPATLDLEGQGRPKARPTNPLQPFLTSVNFDDEYVAKIASAGSVLVEEEARFGRYAQIVMEGEGLRLMPAELVEFEHFKRALAADNHAGLHHAATAPNSLAPYAMSAGVGCDSTRIGRHVEQSLPAGIMKKSRRSARGKDTKKVAGSLPPSPMMTTTGQRKSPVRLSPGAALAIAVRQRRKRNAAMMESLRHDRRYIEDELAAIHAIYDRQKDQAAMDDSFEPVSSQNGECQCSTPDVHGVPDYEPQVSHHHVRLRKIELEKRINEVRKQEIILERQAKRLLDMERVHEAHRKAQVLDRTQREALVLERKRRLLGQDASVSSVSASTSSAGLRSMGLWIGDTNSLDSLEDFAAVRIQRIMRGGLARLYVKSLRPLLNSKATVIQSLIRGKLGRRKARVTRLRCSAAIHIQRVWRGMGGRRKFLVLFHESVLALAATNIQRCWRSFMGRRRLRNRRNLRECAIHAWQAVSPAKLTSEDFAELAGILEKVAHGQVQPEALPTHPTGEQSTSIPGVVLQLLHVVCLMVADDDNPSDGNADDVLPTHLAMTVSGGLGCLRRAQIPICGRKTQVDEIPTQFYSWSDASRLLQRRSWLLRKIRQMSAGVSGLRPRLLHLPASATEKYKALRLDEHWNFEGMSFGMGSKACQQLLAWVDALNAVHDRQWEFFEDLSSLRPIWLARTTSALRSLRKAALERARYQRAAEIYRSVAKDGGDPAIPRADQKSPTGLRASEIVNRRSLQEAAKSLGVAADHSSGRMAKILESIIDKERRMQASDAENETVTHEQLSEAYRKAEVALASVEADMAAAEVAATDGDAAAALEISRLHKEVWAAHIAKKEAWAKLQLHFVRCAHGSQWRVTQATPTGDLFYGARAAGEADAAAAIEREHLRICLSTHQLPIIAQGRLDGDVLEGLSGAVRVEVKDRLAAANQAIQHQEAAEAALWKAFDKVEVGIIKRQELTLLLQEGEQVRVWDDPTAEELEEYVKEDQAAALAEEIAMSSCVTPDALLPPTRHRPVLVCFSRDVPAVAKQKLRAQLDFDLPGFFISIPCTGAHCISLEHLATAFASGYSAICECDIGLTEESRIKFLEALHGVNSTILPKPAIILVVGSPANRSGSALEPQLGTSESDDAASADGLIKRRLQHVATAVSNLSEPDPLKSMQLLSAMDTPRIGIVLLLEAVIIILSPNQAFVGPSAQIACGDSVGWVMGDPVSSVSWAAAQSLLADQEYLIKAMREVDTLHIPLGNLTALQRYVQHPAWPDESGVSFGGLSALPLLLRWCNLLVELSFMVIERGGPAHPLSRGACATTEEKLECNKEACYQKCAEYDAVITVYDAHEIGLPQCTKGEGAVTESRSDSYSSLLMHILADMKCFSSTLSLPVPCADRGRQNRQLHIVQVYQECGKLFFSAYNPISSSVVVISIATAEVGALLMPLSAGALKQGSIQQRKISDRAEIFARLSAMLRIELPDQDNGRMYGKGSVSPEKCLPNTDSGVALRLCHERVHLCRVTRRVSGYIAVVSIFAEASGTMQFDVYVPQSCKTLQLTCSPRSIIDILPDASKQVGEFDAIEAGHIGSMWKFIADRLLISPSRALWSSFHKYVPDKLRLRHKGGAGQLKLRLAAFLSGVIHIISFWEVAGARNALRIAAYNCTSSAESEIVLPFDILRMVQGCRSSHGIRCSSSWCAILLKRLSIERGVGIEYCPHLSFDSTVAQTVVTIATSKTNAASFLPLAAGDGPFPAARTGEGRLFRLRLALAVGSPFCAENMRIELWDSRACKLYRMERKWDDLRLSMPELAFVEFSELLPGMLKRQVATISSRFVYDSVREKMLMVDSQGLMTEVPLVAPRAQNPRDSLLSEQVAGRKISSNPTALSKILVRTRQQLGTKYWDLCSEREETLAGESTSKSVGKKRSSLDGFRSLLGRKGGSTTTEQVPSADVPQVHDKNTPVEHTKTKVFGVRSLFGVGRKKEERSPPDEEKLPNPCMRDAPEELEADAQPAEVISDGRDHRSPAIIRDGEKCIFRRAVNVSIDPQRWAEPIKRSGMIVSVFLGKSTPGMAGFPTLRFVVFYPRIAATVDCSIESTEELREVLGFPGRSLYEETHAKLHDPDTLSQEILHALFDYISRSRMRVEIVESDSAAADQSQAVPRTKLALHRSRIYKYFKETPVHLANKKDLNFNAERLLAEEDEGRRQRGRKIYRQARNMNSVVWRITLYDLASLSSSSPGDVSSPALPVLRCSAYEPHTQARLECVLSMEHISRLASELNVEMRSHTQPEMCDKISRHMRVHYNSRGVAELLLPIGDEERKECERPFMGLHARPRAAAVLGRAKDAREGFSKVTSFSQRLGKTECIISVLARKSSERNAQSLAPDVDDGDARLSLIFNLDAPRTGASADIVVDGHMQRAALQGPPALTYSPGEARDSAIRNVASHLEVTVSAVVGCGIDDWPKASMTASFSFEERKPWLSSYRSMDSNDTDMATPQSIRGQPLLFTPANAPGKGDILLRRGIRISGIAVLLTVTTKAPGGHANGGLIWSAHNQDSCTTSILHTGATEVLAHVEGDARKLEPERIRETLIHISERLSLKKTLTGEWELTLHHKHRVVAQLQ